MGLDRNKQLIHRGLYIHTEGQSDQLLNNYVHKVWSE
jgi:hypothetical protein